MVEISISKDNGDGNPKILLVDDDQDFLNLLERKCEKEGTKLHIVKCSDPENALEQIESNSIDGVLSDYKMPGMNGIELLEAVRDKYPDLPFIMFTAHGSENVASKAISAGVTDYIRIDEGLKNLDILSNRIRNAVSSRKLEAELHGVMDRVTDGFFALDTEWRVTYINRAAEQMLNTSKEDLIGKYLWAEFPEGEDSRYQRKYKEAMAAQQPVYFEEYHKESSSWHSLKAYPSETGISVYFKDITQRKESETELETRLEQQRTMTELLRMGIEEKDPVNLQHEAAERVAKTMGVNYATILDFDTDSNELLLAATYGIDTASIGHPVIDLNESYQCGRAFLEKDVAVVEDYREEKVMERPEPIEYLGVESGASTVIGSVDDPMGVLNVYSRTGRKYSENDIEFLKGTANILATIHEHSREHLKVEEYRRVMSAISDGIYILDKNSRFVMVNNAFENLCGYPANQLIGRKPDFIDFEETGDCGTVEIGIKRPDGKEVKVRTQTSPLELPDGAQGRVGLARSTNNLELDHDGPEP